MRNEDQTAVIVLDNSAETTSVFARAVFGLLDKRKSFAFKAPLPATGVNLEDYSGFYSQQPWESEEAILPWAGGLAVFDLPTDDPAGTMEFLKPKGGDVFRRVRKDGTEAEEYSFVRDASGKVTSYVHFSNPSYKENSPIAAAIGARQ
jgi:hypothetical protein